VEAGYAVTLIARAEEDEVRDGIKIRAVRSGSTNRFTRMTIFAWSVLKMALEEDADLYHFHDPELIPVGLFLKARGKRVIYDVHEDVPAQIRTKDWIPQSLRSPVARVANLAESASAKWSDGVIAATPHIAMHFPAEKTIVVQNFPFLDEAVPIVPHRSWDRLVYTGGLTKVRGAREMVRVMEDIGPQGARLTIAGVIRPPSLQQELEAMEGWKYVDFVGWQDRKTLAQIVSRASIGLVLFHPSPNHVESQPNKLFEYMASSLPIVASDFPYWRQFVTDLRCGLQVDPTDSRAIADAVRWLFEHVAEAEQMGKRGRTAIANRFTWDNEAEILISFYKSKIKAEDR
jgi:glycosyltransferase involved in cell wall biosynthesis